MATFDVHYDDSGTWLRSRRITATDIDAAADSLGGGFAPWPWAPADRRQLVGVLGGFMTTITEVRESAAPETCVDERP